jgi:WD40 repeat protein
MSAPADGAPGVAAAPPAPDPSLSPYRGLRPYTEADTAFFFGREAEAEIIAANLLGARLTLLYGPSGVGKSSVLLAGVVGSLRERSRENLAEEDAAGFAVIVVRSWSDSDPLGTIAAAARAEFTALLGRDDLPDPPPGATLADALDHWSGQVRGKLLVVFDQFEEYFLYHELESGPGTFDAQFPQAVNLGELRADFLLSIRDDSLPRLDRFKGRIANLFDNRLQIDHLTLTAARDAVKLPIAEYNRRVPPEQRVEIEEELVNDVLDQVRTGRVSGQGEGAAALRAAAATEARVETPILQVVLTALWEKETEQDSRMLRAQTLVKLGGAGQLVRERLDERMKMIDRGEQDVAAEVARFLVTPSGTKIAYTAADLTQLAYPSPDVAARKYEQVESVLEKLAAGDTRILRTVQPLGSGEPTRYELFHDILGEPILAWRKRYVEQREREAENQRLREEREAEAKRLHEEQEVEERRRRERARRNRLVALAVGLILLLPIFAALSIWALRARNDARRAENSATSVAVASTANAQLSTRPVDDSLLLSLAAYRTSPTVDARSSMIRALEAARRHGVLAILHGFQSPVSSVAFSADGSKLAVGGIDGAVRVWDVDMHRPLSWPLLDPARIPVSSITFSADGSKLAVGGTDGTVRVWDLDAQRQLGAPFTGSVGIAVSGVAFSPDGRTLAVAGSTVPVWDVGAHRQVGRPLPGPAGASVSGVAFSARGTKLAVADGDGTIRLWDVGSRKEVGRRLNSSAGSFVSGVAFSADGSKLAVADSSGMVRLWDVGSGTMLGLLRGPRATSVKIAFGADGTLAVAGGGATVRLWDVGTKRKLGRLSGPAGTSVSGLAFNPRSHTLAAAFNPATVGHGAVWIWDVRAPTRLGRLLAGPVGTFASGVAFAPDGHALAVWGNDPTVRLWDVETGTAFARSLDGPAGTSVRGVAFSPNGSILAVAGSDGAVRLWSAGTQKRLAELKGPAATSASGVAFNRDGSVLAAAGSDGKVRLWDVDTRKERDEVNGPNNTPISSIAFSPNEHTLAVGGGDGTVQLWHVDGKQAADQPLALLLPAQASFSGSGVSGIAFSPDGHTLAVTSSDGTVQLWDVGNHEALGQPLIGGQGSGLIQASPAGVSVAFSPDGRTLVAAGDGAVRLWDVVTHTQLGGPLEGVKGVNGMNGVAVSEDGMIASGSFGPSVSLWKGVLWKDQRALKDQVCALVWGTLSKPEWENLTHVGYRASCD